MGGAVLSNRRFKDWSAQTLVRREHLVSIMQEHIKFAPHPLPEGMVGQLFCIDGIASAAVAIMDYLEERALLEKEKADGQGQEG